MYYDVVPGAGSGDAGGVGYSPSTAAVSEYAGVFEAGCDPAQVRASLNRGSSRRSATPVLETQASQAVVAAAPPSNGKTTPAHDAEREIATPSVTPCYGDDEEGEEEEDVDCLFQLEGVKEDDRYEDNNRRNVVVEDRSNNGSSKNISSSSCRGEQSAGGGMSAHVGRSVAPSALGRYPSAHAVAYSARPSHGRASPAPGRRGPDLNPACVGQEEMRPRDAGRLRVPAAAAAAAAAAEKDVPGVGAGPSAVFFKPTALRTPRVIAPPGRRCVSGGMYRLRLSTSC